MFDAETGAPGGPLSCHRSVMRRRAVAARRTMRGAAAATLDASNRAARQPAPTLRHVPRRRDRPSHRSTVVLAVAQFAAAGVVAVLILGVALSIASRRVGEREAVVDARTQTLIRAQNVVEPALTPGVVSGDPGARAHLDELVRRDVLDRFLVRVKLWDRTGRIVYSDDSRQVGTRYTLGPDELGTIDGGLIKADVSDLSKPENRFERSQGKLLEVYLPVRVVGSDERLLFEAYFRYDTVKASGSRIWRSFAPISLGALVALELVQIPLAWSLARRLRHRQEEREQLLRDALEASDAERRRIAADLHDGVVQDLAGVAFALGGAARHDAVPAQTVTVLDRSAGEVRDSIKSLRSLLVEIYPPNLQSEGLESALGDLVAKASSRGLDATLTVDGDAGDLAPDVATLLYRGTQEALRNVVNHAHATTVVVALSRDDGHLHLEVRDDGVGFDPVTAQTAAASGHFGLHALRDLIADVGGRLDVESAPGDGTRFEIEVPV